jgi:light-harvesting complex II chlorophyll a/b binding protein 4
MPVNVQAKFNLPKFGTKQVSKKAAKPAPKKSAPVSKKSGTISTGTRAGGVGYKRYTGDALWLPNTSRPEWLDGSLPGAVLPFGALA